MADTNSYLTNFQQVIKGIKKMQSALRELKVQWIIMLGILQHNDQESLLSGIFGFLRSSKFMIHQHGSHNKAVHLSLVDITLDSQSSPKVRIKTYSFSNYLGKTDSSICSVTAILPCLAIRGRSSGPLFALEDRK